MEFSSDDIEFARKGVAKKGRRAGLLSSTSPDRETTSTPSTFGDTLLDSSRTSSNIDSPQPQSQAPPRPRIAGGWADDGQKQTKIKSAENIIEQERFRTLHTDNSDDDIPVIPDLDDIQDEMMSLSITKAPSIAVNRVATYKELDSDLLQHGAFAALDDVDLSLLTKSLHQEANVQEPDEPWTWDQLFIEVAGEMHQQVETLAQ